MNGIRWQHYLEDNFPICVLLGDRFSNLYFYSGPSLLHYTTPLPDIDQIANNIVEILYDTHSP